MVYNKYKLIKIGLGKGTLLSGLFGLGSGLFSGFIFFVFFRTMLETWGMANVPTIGLFLLAFLVFPIISFIFAGISGFISLIFLNLFLKLIKGVSIFYKEDSQSSSDKEIPKRKVTPPKVEQAKKMVNPIPKGGVVNQENRIVQNIASVPINQPNQQVQNSI